MYKINFAYPVKSLKVALMSMLRSCQCFAIRQALMLSDRTPGISPNQWR